jgi:3-oxoacyl-[acyl-carrier-protein] synthase-1
MHQRIFVQSHNIVSPLGNTTKENFEALLRGESGICLHERSDIDDESMYASLISDEQLQDIKAYNNQYFTRYETLLCISIKDALKNVSVDISSPKTVLIYSSTKGNISMLETNKIDTSIQERISLYHSAQKMNAYFKNPNQPIVISNACISGIAAIIYAKRILEAGLYQNAIVVGADTISKFVYSGFKSFRALSQGTCKPFSSDRDGINLGEAAATIVLSTTIDASNFYEVKGGSISNDSNHISGPSKTGTELSSAINKALNTSQLTPMDVDFISAHGTATLYNDEMEVKAFQLSGLLDIPINSLKGYFGHTLGAAGIVESVISLCSLQHNIVIPTKGFFHSNFPANAIICSEPLKRELNVFLKTASGFGGCNAAIVFQKSIN